ncbi:conserved Plasmodium protein, unknown function [Plasmodium knowlesi strain H]|uniref:Uncharacterized protein n=3 Tax=Plasmodium knowlesi TaxID=5850 RepID=A0A5K1VGY7_PLAKH|nr:conserved Plasmodium protein, unknown function [Plasmodium knowlesi strain H]OTN63924.1 Uncharacterized protein PKNOH_S140250800 [Plasmodium knowlesi]CAA9990925.1 conserved Plasmodium protein, unknown function [Plasmodium knowlesi strain H]SBO20853.1 conserved Plasmodium protein, unknown function [Plasmodium knowlesi strain H]SBO21274.1 conserved Plasmodium protein, unknown function [Plasmodium knowlesi strain H]VVS80399.1 conserved Plasmodium protein, unknown function [Plasmodium knowlesi |eukprot:XP_002262210.1 hypothetical protein, conserved in Plasmodium species [Plasmodium knowlesi strain H]
MHLRKREFPKNDAFVKSSEMGETSMCVEDEIFSNSTLSDAESCYKFWKNADRGDIFEICEEFESSEDESVVKDMAQNLGALKLYSSVETNTVPVNMDTTVEDDTCVKDEVENPPSRGN